MWSLDTAALELKFAKMMFKWDTAGRRRLWLKLAKLIGNGVPILTALEFIRDRRIASSGRTHPQAIAAQHWATSIKNGSRLSGMLVGWVGDDERMLIAAGEQSGSVEKSLISAAEIMEARSRIKSAVIGGLAYPLVLLGLSFAMTYLFGFKVVPAFTQVVQGSEWTGMAHLMVKASQFVQQWLWLIALIVTGLIIAFYISLARWNGSLRIVFDRYIPYSIYRVVLGSTWLISFSALVEAGMRVENALRQLSDGATPWMKVRIEACLRGMQAGRSVGESLARSGYEFPDREIIDDLGVYSSLSGFDVALAILGKEWLNESVDQIKSRMSMVFSVSILIMGALIAFMVSGMISMELQVASIMKMH